MNAKAEWSAERALTIIERNRHMRGALLPILHALQEEFGYVDEAAVPLLAHALNLSRADVHGVISFYHDFRQHPPGHHVVKVCRAEACQANGCQSLIDHVHDRFGIGMHETTADGRFTLEPVFCLGNCALGPAVMIGEDVHGRVDAHRFDALIAALEAGEAAAEPIPAPGDRTPVTIYVPRDAAALSAGADATAAAIEAEAARRGMPVSIVRNGSRGLLWLEPMVEVAVPDGARVAYGPVAAADVPGLFDAGFLTGGAHPLGHGPTEEIPFLKRQERLTFARCGVIDPLSVEDYRAHGGFRGLDRALTMSGAEIVAEVTDSGLRGRGGAGFPTGIKWRTVMDAKADEKFVCCNADEGDSGTFADRMIIEGDPFCLIEGMTIAGIAVGATHGYVYMRSEYPHATETLREAIRRAYEQGWLGDTIHGSHHTFHLEVRVGAGAYICGEETSMLESLEGKRGLVRAKPPLPALEGLFGKPTIVNNVLSLTSIPVILDKGAAFYRDFGVGRSRGTLPFQLAGNIKHGGIVETAFGITLQELLYDFGGGTLSGRPIRAVQVGGPLGAYLPPSQFNTPKCYEEFAKLEAMVGHGGIVVFDDTVDMARQARFAMEFCAEESCGKCTPCRIGAVRGVEVIDRIIAGRESGARDVAKNMALLADLCDVMVDGSLCAMGGMTPYPVRSAMKHFPEDFQGTQTAIAAE